MWIRVQTKVTIRSITIARGSIRIPALKLANQCIDWWTISSFGYISLNIPKDSMNPAKVARTVKNPPPFGRCQPRKIVRTKASTGRPTIR
ncbi:MAG: hypothetical protein A4E51_01039 [Methanosaeta sp. PtaU1.Bin055]|nr:MAG: hypothetical protein A4E51_01039 [Methanosaeta sp. PtaU1.Bin055]